jgi:hypothetical protein
MLSSSPEIEKLFKATRFGRILYRDNTDNNKKIAGSGGVSVTEGRDVVGYTRGSKLQTRERVCNLQERR